MRDHTGFACVIQRQLPPSMENEGLCVRILACLLLLHSELSDANFAYYLDGVMNSIFD